MVIYTSVLIVGHLPTKGRVGGVCISLLGSGPNICLMKKLYALLLNPTLSPKLPPEKLLLVQLLDGIVLVEIVLGGNCHCLELSGWE